MNSVRPEQFRIVEWEAPSRVRYLDGRILGVVTHVIIPEIGIVPLDLELDVPDSAGPAFKILIDAARLFGRIARQDGFCLSAAAGMEHGSTRMERIFTD